MKYIYIKIILLIICSLTIVLIYFNSNFFISKQQWKYNNGYSIGDWLNLSDETINNGSINRNDKVNVKILFCFGKILIIEESNSGEKGYYSNKSWY